MENMLPLIGVALLALACPLMMVGMGVGAWLIARARGQKKELSMGCMPMGGHSAPPEADAEESGLKNQVARLERKVQELQARTSPESHTS